MKHILDVRFQSQLDNGPEGYRQCFTSSSAMLLDFLQPGVLSETNGDLDYLAVLEQFGDTTDPFAHVEALRSFGVQCDFITNGSFALLEQQIDQEFLCRSAGFTKVICDMRGTLGRRTLVCGHWPRQRRSRGLRSLW